MVPCRNHEAMVMFAEARADVALTLVPCESTTVGFVCIFRVSKQMFHGTSLRQEFPNSTDVASSGGDAIIIDNGRCVSRGSSRADQQLCEQGRRSDDNCQGFCPPNGDVLRAVNEAESYSTSMFWTRTVRGD